MSIPEEVMVEIADNWPAFTYITLVCISSVVFLRERRAEAQLLKQASAKIQEEMQRRFDRLEKMIRDGTVNDGSRAFTQKESIEFRRPS